MKGKTLAQLISETRENIGLSQKGLATKANISLSTIENVESGQELFLSTTVRQKLAKALKLEPKRIKILEKNMEIREVPQDYIEELKLRILDGQLSGNLCPICKSELVCRIAEMYDLEDNLVRHPKARCSKCVFQIK